MGKWTNEHLGFVQARKEVYGLCAVDACFRNSGLRTLYSKSVPEACREYATYQDKYDHLAANVATLEAFNEYIESQIPWRAVKGSCGLAIPTKQELYDFTEAVATGFTVSGVPDDDSVQDSMKALRRKFCAKIAEILEGTDETTFVHDNMALSPYIQGVCVLEYLRGSESALKTLRAFMERANPALRDKSSGLTPADYKSYCRDREKQARDIAEQEARDAMIEVDRARAEQAQQDTPKKVKEG